MFAILVASGLVFAQAAAFTLIDGSTEHIDASYEQLAAGETQAAIARLEAALTENPSDPALLINLGSAYLDAGDYERAAAAYRAAAASEDRYQLELADGRWVDSRTAARRALRALETSGFALR